MVHCTENVISYFAFNDCGATLTFTEMKFASSTIFLYHATIIEITLLTIVNFGFTKS